MNEPDRTPDDRRPDGPEAREGDGAAPIPASDDAPNRGALARRMVSSLPRFGYWANAIRDFETPHGKVGFRQLSILWAVRHEFFPADTMSPTVLAAFYQVQPSVITKALAKLEALALVERTSDPRDSRRSLISITPKGLEVSRFIEQLFVSDVADSIAGITDE